MFTKIKRSFVFWIFLISVFSIQINCQAQKITKGPYLAVPGSSYISIKWEADKKAKSMLLFGENRILNRKNDAKLIGTKSGFYLYESRLTGLKPQTRYFYQVICGDTKSVVTFFNTAPLRNSPFSFVAMGDSRSYPETFSTIMEQVNKLKPDLIISMGDLVENGGKFKQWGSQYFEPAKSVIDHIPLISALGDHEGDGDNGKLFKYFFYPNMNVNRLWFSFDFGDAHFVSLDYRHPYDKDMIRWFKKDMAKTKAKWKFVYMHRPCYNLGGHRSAWGRKVWPALFRKFKVDIVFAGHSHLYERFFPVRPSYQPRSWPVTYITTGGAGAELYEIGHSNFLAKSESIHHFVYFRLNGDTLSMKAYSLSDSLFDNLVIIKHDGKYSKMYLDIVKPQEQLDAYTMFLRAISSGIDKIPLKKHPATVVINLKSVPGTGNINFRISLSSASENNYRMDPVKGILHKNEKLNIPVHIFSKGDVTVSKWGEIRPSLRLKAVCNISGEKQNILGGKVEYWPGNY